MTICDQNKFYAVNALVQFYYEMRHQKPKEFFEHFTDIMTPEEYTNQLEQHKKEVLKSWADQLKPDVLAQLYKDLEPKVEAQLTLDLAPTVAARLEELLRPEVLAKLDKEERENRTLGKRAPAKFNLEPGKDPVVLPDAKVVEVYFNDLQSNDRAVMKGLAVFDVYVLAQRLLGVIETDYKTNAQNKPKQVTTTLTNLWVAGIVLRKGAPRTKHQTWSLSQEARTAMVEIRRREAEKKEAERAAAKAEQQETVS